MRGPASPQSSILEAVTGPAAPPAPLEASSAKPLRQPLNLAAHIFSAYLRGKLAEIVFLEILSTLDEGSS